MTFTPNPEAERLSNLALNVADGLLHARGGPFAVLGRLSILRRARSQAECLDASGAFLTHFDHVISAVDVLDGGKRRMSLREARRTLEHDIPRMNGSAHWPGYRAQLRLPDNYPKAVSAEFFERASSCHLDAAGTPEYKSPFSHEDCVRHPTFGYGRVREIEGSKLLVAFDESGEKKVIDAFVEKV